MPFVRIDLVRGKSVQYRKTIGEIVYNAMRDVIDVPKDDKFQIITEHPLEDFNVSESYLGNQYSKDVVPIQITLNAGRSVEQKKAYYKRILTPRSQLRDCCARLYSKTPMSLRLIELR